MKSKLQEHTHKFRIPELLIERLMSHNPAAECLSQKFRKLSCQN